MTTPNTQLPYQSNLPATKADMGKRIIAAIIDGVLCGVVGWIPVAGWIISTVYVLVRDGLELDFMDRRSLGKKVMKLRPIRLDGQPMDVGTSVRRNLPFAVGAIGTVIAFVPFIGWLVALLIGLAAFVIAILELVLVITDAEGRRLGDKLAGTKVIEVAD